MLGEIISSVDSVTIQIAQVATASEEQSATAEQISKNVEFIEPEHLIIRRRKPPTIKTHELSWCVNVHKRQYGRKRKFSFNMIPDSIFGLRKKNNNKTRETYFFLEADRATMPIRRTNLYQSSFYKKMVYK